MTNSLDLSNLTREQAVSLLGETVIAKLDNEGCDFTGRILPDWDDRYEFSASVHAEDADGYDVIVTVIYFQSKADVDGLEDLGCLDWSVDHYEVE